jgi:hypothetical protein
LKFIFASGVEKKRWRFRFWEWCTKGLTVAPILSADDQDVVVIVGDGFEESVTAVHVWMMGVGFIVVFMTPCFIAMHMGKEDTDD